MTDRTKPRVPAGVGTAGGALWRRLTGAYTFEVHELSMLEVACRQADDVAALENLIAEQGMTVAGSQGQPRLNAAVAEVRQGRLALGKLLGALALPDEADRALTAASRQAQRAGRARWDRRSSEQQRRASRLADGA